MPHGTRLTNPEISEFLDKVKTPNKEPGVKTLKAFNNEDFDNNSLTDCNYCGSSFQYASFNNATLSRIDMHAINGDSLTAENAKLSYVDFSLANLDGASFEKARLEFVFFIGANLNMSNFLDATCKKGVLMIGSTLDAELKPDGAILTPDDLQAVIDQYKPQELELLKNTLEQAAIDVDSYRSSPKDEKNYLTQTHHAHINEAIQIIDNALGFGAKTRVRM